MTELGPVQQVEELGVEHQIRGLTKTQREDADIGVGISRTPQRGPADGSVVSNGWLRHCVCVEVLRDPLRARPIGRQLQYSNQINIGRSRARSLIRGALDCQGRSGLQRFAAGGRNPTARE